MNFEDLQQTWQRQPVPVVHDQSALLEKVQAGAAAFEHTIRRRDNREIGAALLVSIIFGLMVPRHGWPYAFVAAESLVLAAFFLFDRRRQRRWADAFDETLLGQLDRAIRLTAHQLWLLKNIFWWYLLPFLVGMLLIHAHEIPASTWRERFQWAAPKMLFDWLIVGGIYWLNQRAVRTKLHPRLKELSALRDRLRAADQN